MDNNNMFDSEDLTGSFDTNDIEQNKAISAIAYIPILFLVPMLASQSPYAKFHANQGSYSNAYFYYPKHCKRPYGFLFLSWVPILPTLISAVFSLATLALLIIGIINAVQGKAKKLPVVGGLFNIIH